MSFAQRCGVHDAARQAACQAVLRRVQEAGVQQVRVSWADLHGTLRGKTLVCDEGMQALADALRAGRLGGAAIDVLPQEPPVDGNPLLALDIPNLIVTPHVAWAAREARQRCLDEMAANVEDFARGGHRGRVV